MHLRSSARQTAVFDRAGVRRNGAERAQVSGLRRRQSVRRAPATSPAGGCSATTTSLSSTPTACGRTSSGESTRRRPRSCGGSLSSPPRGRAGQIALQLNAEGAVSPRAQQQRLHAWAQSSVHEVLFTSSIAATTSGTRPRSVMSGAKSAAATGPRTNGSGMPCARAADRARRRCGRRRTGVLDEARQSITAKRPKGCVGGRPADRLEVSAAGLRAVRLVQWRPLRSHLRSRHRRTRRRAYSLRLHAYHDRGPTSAATDYGCPWAAVTRRCSARCASCLRRI